MKKLLSIIPLSLVLAACASNAPQSVEPTQEAYDRKAPERFICEDDIKVAAKYSISGEEATINVVIPNSSWGNKPQTIVMDRVVSGSGARYVNSTNKAISYEWHTKSDMGLFNMAWADGKTYSVTCKK